MAVVFEIVLDCADLDRQSDFWCAALGYRVAGSAGNYRSLVDPGEVLPRLLLQAVSETKTVKNRMHLDVQHDDIEAEAARLIGLGASRPRGEPFVEHGNRWILLADPEGNELCVCETWGVAPDAT